MTRCQGKCAVISLVGGGVHAHAYALALKQLTGVDMTKMLPMPNIQAEKFSEARQPACTAVLFSFGLR